MNDRTCPSVKSIVVFAAALMFALLPAVFPPARSPFAAQKPAGGTAVYGYRVVNAYPHDRQAYTQGLIFSDGFLYESTGLYGASTLRRVQLETGRVLAQHALDRRYFGEGLTEWEGSLLQLTWTSNVGFVYERSGLTVQGTFRYPGEGWGLTHDRKRLIMSDGTATLRFLDPRSFRETGRLPVLNGAVPLAELNELEFVRGEIFANIYRTDRIARISPQSGRVVGWIDLSGLLPEREKGGPVDVLNGIAYDGRRDRFFVTGKLWPKLFEIELFRRE